MIRFTSIPCTTFLAGKNRIQEPHTLLLPLARVGYRLENYYWIYKVFFICERSV